MKKPDFFCKDFRMVRKLYCDSCKGITDHQIQVIKDSPEDGGVPCLKACEVCFQAYDKLVALDLDAVKPVYFQRFLTQAYVFLVLHEHYLD